MPTAYRRKLIEVDLPLDAINAESAREKSIRHGHPSTLHLWWARRPLAACRAVIFASLVDDPVDFPEEFPDADAQAAERERLHYLIRRLVVWENSSDANLLAEARYEIARSVARSHDEAAPTEPAAVLDYLNRQAKPIYDPFCGGGSIPLEAQRLGLRAVGSDLNPVAVLITKALIELPPKFANRPPANPDADPMGMTVGKGRNQKQVPWRGASGMADDIRYYGRKMREMAWERIGHLYPKAKLPDGGEATVIAWLWARTVPCPNPACGVAMPLMRTFQLSTKNNNQHWTKPVIDRKSKSISFTVQNHDSGMSDGGTVNRNGATCIACNGAVKLGYVREQGRAGNLSEQMSSIVAEGNRKRVFISPTREHIETATEAEPDWRPHGTLPKQARSISVQIYGFTEWNQLFTQRQLTTLTIFNDLIHEMHSLIQEGGALKHYADAICTYLALIVDKSANGNSSFATWDKQTQKIPGVFGRQGIPMVWDFAEANPFSMSTQSWIGHVELVAKSVEHTPPYLVDGWAHQADASTTIHAQDGPIIVTDPPYYDNIHYADSSDFFYPWLRRALQGTYPDLFAGIVTPKNEEMIASRFRFEDPRGHFEHSLNKTLALVKARCTSEFPSSIFYAYKQKEEEREGITSTGWETMLTALVNAGFQIVGTWPMRTESVAHLKKSVNALASSVVLVCRPRPDDAPNATRGDFMDALARELPSALQHLTRESHIAPVDLRQAAIGPGMAVYSRYDSVTTLAGEPVTVRQALAAINDAVAAFLEQQAGQLDAESRFCLDWLQAHPGGQGNYGLAEDLARAYNMSIEDRLAREHRLLTSGQGQVTLLGIDDYDETRSYPRAGEDVTAWEACHRMAWHMQPGEDGRGAQGCVAVAQHAGDRLDDVERLARILYDIYDRRNDSRRAVAFNSVVTAWPNIAGQVSGPAQQELFV